MSLNLFQKDDCISDFVVLVVLLFRFLCQKPTFRQKKTEWKTLFIL